jgi:cell division protein FtsB
MASDERSAGFISGFSAKRVMIVAAIFIVAYFGLSVASNAIMHTRLEARGAALRDEIAALERREARLQALKNYMESDAFVEAAAREQGLVRPGEYQVVLLGPSAEDRDAVQPGDPWWFRYLHPDDRR